MSPAKNTPETEAEVDPPFDLPDELKDLYDALDVPPPEGWQPNPGDKIAGVVVDLGTADVGGYGEYPLVTLQLSPEKQVAVHAFHTVLQHELERLRFFRSEVVPNPDPRSDRVLRQFTPNDDMIGVRMAFKYEGATMAKGARPGKDDEYHSYRVVVDRSTLPANRTLVERSAGS